MAAASNDREGSQFIKSCACGVSYERDEWAELRYLGEQDDGIDVWELRICRKCGSTLAVHSAASTDRMP